MKKRRIKMDNSPRGPAIEQLGDGQQTLLAGTHPSGVRYQWSPGLPDQIPTLSLDLVNSVWTTLVKTYATSESAKDNQTVLAPAPSQLTQTTLTTISDAEWQQLLDALRFLLPHVGSNDEWSSIGYSLLSLQGSGRPVEQLWLDWSQKAAGFEPGAPEVWWEAHKSQTPRSDYRHIFKLARERGLPRVADPGVFAPINQVSDAGAQSSATRADGGAETHDGGSDGSQPANSGQISVVPDGPIKPIIQLAETRYSAIVDQLEEILLPYAYVQGPHLVRQSEAHSNSEITRQSDALMLIHVTKAWAVKRLGELCDWQKWLKSDQAWVGTKPSIEHITTLLELGGWRNLRPLEALQRSPFVREDGTICDEPGYDNRSRVLYVPSTTFPRIPTAPNYAEANASLERLRGVFDQFPWKEPASESTFLSHILSEAARTAIDRCPMFFYDAPSSGTGKSLLQEMAARIVHGTDPALRSWVGDGNEIRKSLYAAVLAGDRSLWFDNVPDGHKIRAPELCAFISSSTWTDRKLGESESLGVPNKMVLVASGNNITPSGDMARRSLVVRMDANTSKLRERVFRIPLLRTYVMENRAELLVHALTVIKAFHAAKGIKGMPIPLPGFERWSHFCRNPLIWLGMEDPVITQENETDDEASNVGGVYTKLFANFGSNAFTSLDVARLVNGITDSAGELANELQANGCSEPNNPTKIGFWLRGCRDRIGQGLKLVRAGRNNSSVKWKLLQMHEDLT